MVGPGYRCGVLWKPSLGVGGDFVDIVPLASTGLDVIVGDVMGKGVQAALLAAAVKNHLLRAAHTLCDAHGDPASIIQEAHKGLHAQLESIESFVTLSWVRLDVSAWTMQLVDAGHTRTLLLRQGVCRTLAGSNLPLGFRADERYEARSVPLQPGDVLLVYTDGVTESRDRDGHLLGEAWLTSWLEQHGRLAPSELLGKLRNSVETWGGSGARQDDVTAVCVRLEAQP